MRKTTVVEPVLMLSAAVLLIYIAANVQLIYRKVCLNKFNSTYCDLIDQSTNDSYLPAQNAVQEETASWSVYSSV